MIKELIAKYTDTQYKKNVSRSIIVYALNALLLFLSYPVYIHYLGVELFSVWSLLAIILSFAELGNFGMGDALVVYTSESYKNNDIVAIEKYLVHSLYVILVPLICFFPILLNCSTGICKLLNIPSQYISIAVPIVPYIYIVIVLYLVNDMLKAILVGLGRLDLANILFVSSNAAKLLIAILFFIGGFKLWGMLYSIIIAYSLLCCCFIYFLIKNGIRVKLFQIEFPIIKKLLIFGSKMLGISILNMLMMPVSKIILAKNQLSTVAYFEIGSKVVYAIFGIIQKGVYAMLPQSSGMKNEKDSKQKIGRLCEKTSLFFIKIAVPILLILGATSMFWMKWWLGSNYNVQIPYCYNIIQFGVFVAIAALPYYYSLLGSGKETICLIESIIRVGINLLMLFILSLFGVNSPIYVYACFAASTMLSNMYILLYGKHFLR